MHQRSPQAIVRRYINRVSHRDKILAETISLCSRAEAMVVLSNYWEGQELKLARAAVARDVPDVETADVLADTRGRGIFQK